MLHPAMKSKQEIYAQAKGHSLMAQIVIRL